MPNPNSGSDRPVPATCHIVSDACRPQAAERSLLRLDEGDPASTQPS
jgi:hypothetical protein